MDWDLSSATKIWGLFGKCAELNSEITLFSKDLSSWTLTLEDLQGMIQGSF